MEDMMTAMDGFAGRSKRMPKRVREWPAALSVKKMVDDFLVMLPMMRELSKESIRCVRVLVWGWGMGHGLGRSGAGVGAEPERVWAPRVSLCVAVRAAVRVALSMEV